MIGKRARLRAFRGRDIPFVELNVVSFHGGIGQSEGLSHYQVAR